MVTLSVLQDLSKTSPDLRNCADIESVRIDASKSAKERLESFLSQVKNPYCFSCCGIAVKVSFTANGKPLSDKLAEHFIRNKVMPAPQEPAYEGKTP